MIRRRGGLCGAPRGVRPAAALSSVASSRLRSRSISDRWRHTTSDATRGVQAELRRNSQCRRYGPGPRHPAPRRRSAHHSRRRLAPVPGRAALASPAGIGSRVLLDKQRAAQRPDRARHVYAHSGGRRALSIRPSRSRPTRPGSVVAATAAASVHSTNAFDGATWLSLKWDNLY
jgi:hypothetical protein